MSEKRIIRVYPNIIESTDVGIEQFEYWIDDMKELNGDMELIAIVDSFDKLEAWGIKSSQSGLDPCLRIHRNLGFGFIGDILIFEENYKLSHEIWNPDKIK